MLFIRPPPLPFLYCSFAGGKRLLSAQNPQPHPLAEITARSVIYEILSPPLFSALLQWSAEAIALSQQSMLLYHWAMHASLLFCAMYHPHYRYGLLVTAGSYCNTLGICCIITCAPLLFILLLFSFSHHRYPPNSPPCIAVKWGLWLGNTTLPLAARFVPSSADWSMSLPQQWVNNLLSLVLWLMLL